MSRSTTRETPEGWVRRCVDCKVEKFLETEFAKNRTCYRGYAYACRGCNSKRACDWSKANREHVQQKQKSCRLTNKEHVAKKRRDWYAKNASQIRARVNARRERPEVKVAERWKWIKVNYGLTKEQWFGLFERQGNRCGCCGRTEPASKRGWHVDHDHTTGKVRGIVCHGCNMMIGAARDSVDVLASGIDYLNRTK